MALGLVDDSTGTGWTFQGTLDEPGYGYVMHSLMHDLHPYMKNIRVEQIQIAGAFSPLTSSSKSWTEGNFMLREAFKLGSLKRTLGPNRSSSIWLPYRSKGVFFPEMTALTVYEMRNVFGEPNQSLAIALGHMFTSYAKNPVHEPSGSIKAARVYPVVRFLSPPPNSPLKDIKNRISAIRVIYRIELNISGYNFEQVKEELKNKIPNLSETELEKAALRAVLALGNRNQIGTWTDHDDPTSKVASAFRLKQSKKWPGYLVFARAEKPLMWETTSSGLLEGFSKTTSKGTLWDNIHQWQGGYNTKKEFENLKKNGGMPPSPGMPYAAHLHWRWSADAFKSSFLVGPGGKQFGGIGGAGGPMIDPNITDQDINFAVTREKDFEFNRDIIDEYYTNNRHVFGIQDTLEDLISNVTGKKKSPRDISRGDNLVLWLDFATRSKYLTDAKEGNNNSFEGSFFVNGLFFAHEPPNFQLPFLTRKLPGVFQPQFIPNTPQHRWDRL